MASFLILLIIVTAILVLAITAYLIIGRSKKIVQAWADSQGYELLKCHYRAARKGPFLLTSSSGQTTCRISIRTSDGRIKNGWIKCGGFFLGIMNNKVKVVWDD